jgi:thioredoxin-like negative regulator of GroEL
LPDLTQNKDELLRNWLKESEQNLVVLVFSASWSGGAHISYTYVKQLALSIPGMKYYLIDIEERPDLAAYFNVRQVPVLVVLRKQEIIHYIQGTISKKKLLDKLQSK